MKKPRVLAPMILLLLVVIAPVLLAWRQTSTGQVFGGFVFNPLDGNSYLAKMQQGWAGNWFFVLPYTAEPGQGAFLFAYYLFLGHLARVLHLPLVVMFHLARLVGAALLVLALRDFLMAVFPSNPRAIRRALWLALFGGGLGWLAALTGVFSPDLWVAEAFPFLASFANPHFPLGMALLLWILAHFAQPARASARGWLELFTLGLLLSVVMPFGVVTAGVIAGATTLWALLAREKDAPVLQLTALVGGGLYLVYQYIAILRDPILSGWNAQNVTLSPPLWDTLLGFSPALLAGAAALPMLLRKTNAANRLPIRLLAVWLALGLVLVYVPFNLQRRFLFAYFVPAASLAVAGLDALPGRLRRWGFTALMALSLPSMLIVWLAGYQAGKSSPDLVYTSSDETRAMQWVAENTPRDALILASDEMGLFMPARTGRRVFYGHPFETVESTLMRTSIEQYFRGDGMNATLTRVGVDYIFYGPRERKLGRPANLSDLPVAFQTGEVTIYALENMP